MNFYHVNKFHFNMSNWAGEEREVNYHRYDSQEGSTFVFDRAFSASALPRFISGKDRNRMRKKTKVSSMQTDKKIHNRTAV